MDWKRERERERVRKMKKGGKNNTNNHKNDQEAIENLLKSDQKSMKISQKSIKIGPGTPWGRFGSKNGGMRSRPARKIEFFDFSDFWKLMKLKAILFEKSCKSA